MNKMSLLVSTIALAFSAAGMARVSAASGQKVLSGISVLTVIGAVLFVCALLSGVITVAE